MMAVVDDWVMEEVLEHFDYGSFIDRKSHMSEACGFTPVWMPDCAFDFQKYLATWNCETGRSATLADCGLGKTLIELIFAENVVRKTNKRVLIGTPLAVSHQIVSEGEKFGVEVVRSKKELPRGKKIIVTNYENLHHFAPADFTAFVADESSILKNFQGVRRNEITEFVKKMPYRLLASATAAPNDYIELGTSSEALGYLGHMDMLNRFFKNDLNNSAQGRMHGEVIRWRFKGHAEEPFWRWVCSWARSIRRPSDLGFDDGNFILPELSEVEHVVDTDTLRDGWLYPTAAVGMREQREERRISLRERCEKSAALCEGHDSSLVWCQLNPEGDLLEKLIPNAVQVSGKDSDDAKEEKLLGFARGQIRRLITKPKIGAFGLNLQNCAHQVTFPSHSFEQYYQQVRRSWRFGQKRNVTVDIVRTHGDQAVMENQWRKARQADEMFTRIVERMNEAIGIKSKSNFGTKTEVPAWL